METILILLSNVSSTILNYFFICLMLFLGLLSFKAKDNEERKSLFINSIPVLGMLGTFLGISIGLYKFDVSQINNSIPILLSGMKVAFITSVCGILFSLIFRFLHQAMYKKNEKENTELDAINKIIEKLSETNELISNKDKEKNNIFEPLSKLNILSEVNTKLDGLKKLNNFDEKLNKLDSLNKISESLNSLNLLNDLNTKLDRLNNLDKLEDLSVLNSIDEKLNELSLLKKLDNLEKLETLEKLEKLELLPEIKEILVEVQNKLLILEDMNKEIENHINITKENGELLVKEFKNFAQQMAENNNKAFIEALNESMKDLNNHLTEQFGENFKELNKAVYKLVEWQLEYKEIVEKTTENQRVIYENLDNAKNGISEFASEGRNIVDISKDFKDIIEEINREKIELLEILGTFSELSSQSKELLPNLKEIQNNLSDSIDSFDKQLTEVVLNISETANKNSETLNQTNESLNNFVENFKNNSEDLLEAFNKNSSELLEMQNKASIEVIEDVGEKIKLVSEELTVESLKISEQLTETLTENIERNNKLTNEAVMENTDQIKEFLASSLQESLRTLGDQHIEILNHFVENFEQMLESLKKVNEAIKRR